MQTITRTCLLLECLSKAFGLKVWAGAISSLARLLQPASNCARRRVLHAGALLGNWHWSGGVRMSCSHEGDILMWEAQLLLPWKHEYKYKYAVVSGRARQHAAAIQPWMAVASARPSPLCIACKGWHGREWAPA